MHVTHANHLILAATFAAVLPLAACSVTVQEGRAAEKDVDISTPVGDLSVRAGGTNPDTGLPAYPGARPLREKNEPQNANVNIDTAWFGMKVVAATFESDDAPEMIAAFYRREMRAHGAVTECRGEVDFEGDSQEPACKQGRRSEGIQLVVGTQERHRIVAIKPRGTGSELALVYLQTRGVS